MTDQPSTSVNGADGANGQAKLTTLPINVLAQYLKDLSFENPRAPQSLMQGQAAPEISVQVDLETALQAENIHEVTLKLRVEAKTGTDVVFLVEVAYAALIALPGLPPEHLRPVLLIEGPRLLFPFVRAIIADATRNGGYPALLLHPIDFADLYRRQKDAH